MAITAINVSGTDFDEGRLGPLELPLDPPLKMMPLGKLVILAGENGAGKSRLLRLLTSLAPHRLNDEKVENQRNNASRLQGEIYRFEGDIAVITGQRERMPDAAQFSTDSRPELRHEIAKHQRSVLEIEANIRMGQFMSCDTAETPQLVNFCPKDSVLVDPSNASNDEIVKRCAALGQLGANQTHLGAPCYALTTLKADLWSKGRGKASDVERAKQLAAVELNQIVTSLLGPSNAIDLDAEFNLTIGGHRDYSKRLSAGQQILFQIACLLHAQGASLGQCVVLMDEPENHLHPAVLAQVVDEILQRLGSHGQLWIATHSVPLIAHLVQSDPTALWYVEGGRVVHAGRTPEKVLENLMGGPAGATALHDFTMLPAQYAAAKFMSECLLEPGVIGVNVRDKQTNQIAQIIDQVRGLKTGTLRLLDFGAGKARLLATLAALDAEVRSSIDYFAFDPARDYESQRLAQIGAVYGPNEASSRCINDLSDLRSRLDAGSVDVVVMCNVLHEIHPQQWLKLFGCDGLLSKLLAPNDVLLVVEDYGIPIGERAHEFGFLLLDEHELAALFCVNEADRTALAFVRATSDEDRYRDRLVAHLISVDCVRRVSHASQRSAIAHLRQRTIEAVSDILRSEPGQAGAEGRGYALKAQLLVNATLWLDAAAPTESGNCAPL